MVDDREGANLALIAALCAGASWKCSTALARSPIDLQLLRSDTRIAGQWDCRLTRERLDSGTDRTRGETGPKTRHVADGGSEPGRVCWRPLSFRCRLFGTERTWRDVRLESVLGPKAVVAHLDKLSSFKREGRPTPPPLSISGSRRSRPAGWWWNPTIALPMTTAGSMPRRSGWRHG
jgi:hypothetical protein